jgi:hypothetical protein
MTDRTLNTLTAVGVWLFIVLVFFVAYIRFLELARLPSSGVEQPIDRYTRWLVYVGVGQMAVGVLWP